MGGRNRLAFHGFVLNDDDDDEAARDEGGAVSALRPHRAGEYLQGIGWCLAFHLGPGPRM